VACADLALGRVAFVVGVDAVARVGEPDAAVGLDDHVVGRVEAFAVETLGQHLAPAVEADARDAAAAVLTRDQPAFAIDRVSIGVQRRLLEHRDRAVGLVPAQHPVVRDVRPHQVAPGREPGRPFGPAAAGVQLLDMHVAEYQRREARVDFLEVLGQADTHVAPQSVGRRPRP
jgi:hypothetical protein